MTTPANLPLIDITALRLGNAQSQHAVAEQLHIACETHGFFYVTGHGIDSTLIDEVFASSQDFFAQDMHAKLAVDKRHSTCNRGYEPLRAQTLEAGAPPDLKESFYIGEEMAEDNPQVLAGRFNTGPNLWPSAPHNFRPVMQAYYDAMHTLSATIVRGLALSLDLENTHFDAYLEGAASTLRLLHYPPQPTNPYPNEKGCGAHTDFGGVTLLMQDDVGGLQVWDTQAAAWMDAPPVPNAFVVNIGDLFARWTNDRYVSTLHRVINTSGRQRYSLPFFFTGNPLHLVECIPTCLPAGSAPKYPPITVEAHLMDCYRRTYA